MSFPSLVSGPSRDPFFELAITSIGKKGLDPQTLVPVTGNGVINMSLITATLRPSLVQLSFTGTPRLHLMDRHCGAGTSGKDLDKDLVLKALKAKGRRSITQLLDDTRRTDTAIREAVRALVSETAIRVIATRGKARLYELIVPEDEANGEDV